jgi:hypothetical protein
MFTGGRLAARRGADDLAAVPFDFAEALDAAVLRVAVVGFFAVAVFFAGGFFFAAEAFAAGFFAAGFFFGAEVFAAGFLAAGFFVAAVRFEDELALVVEDLRVVLLRAFSSAIPRRTLPGTPGHRAAWPGGSRGYG